MGKFYSVRKGREVGIFNTWSECQEKIKGYPCAEFKSFKTIEEARAYLDLDNSVVFDEDIVSVVSYVDGSYEDTIKRYGSGIVIIKNNEIILEKSFGGNEESLISMRNVAGEIKAAEYVMNYCVESGNLNLTLYYDYLGIEKWCTGEWKTNKEGTIRYKQYYDDFIKKGLKVNFLKVKAHSGDKYNNLADSLAKKGLIK